MKLSKKALALLNENKRVMNLIAYELDTHYETVARWVRQNKLNSMLTTMQVLNIIHTELKIDKGEILTGE